MPKDPDLKTISVNLPSTLVKRIQALGFNHNLSASSIVELSLEAFLDGMSEQQTADRLRERGATLRRAAR